MKKIVISLILCFCVVLGASYLTMTAAYENHQKEDLWLMQTLLPGSESFTTVPYDGEDSNIVSVHQGKTGFVVETKTNGYADEITMLVAVNKVGIVTGLVTREAHETYGLGSGILTNADFLAQLLNKTGSFEVVTGGVDAFSGATGEAEPVGDGLEVDAISGATVSSKAVARCVNSAVAYVTGADAVSEATGWGG